MTDYVKATNFAAKDSLPSGNPSKLIVGAEHNVEYDSIATSSASKANKIASATNNRLVSMDGAGDIKDSNIATDGAGNITADLIGNADTVTTNASLTGPVTSVGNTTSIATGAITATHLAPNSVGSSEIAPNAVGSDEIAANAVGSSEIAPNAVRFSAEIYSSIVSGSFLTTEALTVLGAGVWNLYNPGPPSAEIHIRCNGVARRSLVISSEVATQIVSDGLNVWYKSGSGGTYLQYSRIFS